MKITYYIAYALWYLLSLLPLWLLYFVSDLLFFPTYYLARYRRKIVRRNLTGSFPEKDLKEIVRIEKRFYHFFCDYIVETIKLFSMSEEQMKRRMVFKGVDHIVSAMEKEDKNFCFVYLGHYCNWEWIASLPYWCPDDVKCGQIYHPLYNKAFDRLFLRLRNQFGGECIAMKETLRRIIEMKRAKQKCIIGFISDQAPKWNSIHHWCDFLHRETPVFIGTERIGKQVDALIYYADVKRTRRGYYLCEFKPLTHRPKEVPDYELTDRFTHLLEEMIKERPDFWLWSHKRWKRTKEEWIRRQQEEEKK
ncbi:MAG: lysophospholipid acyltransferase family protein [Bacteroidaceae bacterium]|jgi:KDO2-lipid IV(A) lauroyltransferase|nr:lysophospholipid acyltransferase family protein [Bacteroidaceae bacterium]